MKRLSLALAALGALAMPAFGAGLEVQAVAADTWALVGHTEDLTPSNGGNIANAGFVATGAGVVVIDTSASKAPGTGFKLNTGALLCSCDSGVGKTSM